MLVLQLLLVDYELQNYNHNVCIIQQMHNILKTKRKSKIVKLFSWGQTHKIVLLTDMQNIPKLQYT